MTVFSRTAIYFPQIGTWMDLRRYVPLSVDGLFLRKSIHVLICGQYIVVRENMVMTNIPQINIHMDLRRYVLLSVDGLFLRKSIHVLICGKYIAMRENICVA